MLGKCEVRDTMIATTGLSFKQFQQILEIAMKIAYAQSETISTIPLRYFTDPTIRFESGNERLELNNPAYDKIQQRYLMTIFLQQPTDKIPILQKTQVDNRTVYKVIEGWAYIFGIVRFFKSEVALTVNGKGSWDTFCLGFCHRVSHKGFPLLTLEIAHFWHFFNRF